MRESRRGRRRYSLVIAVVAALVVSKPTGSGATAATATTGVGRQEVGWPSTAGAPAPAVSVVLDGVIVIDVETGRLVANQRVVIAGSRITAMGTPRAVALPAGALTVNARGKYLIPGLWDMHVHPKSSAPLFYPLFVANGVTGVRDAGSDTPLATFTRWKQEIAAGIRVGPRLFVAGPFISECPGGQIAGGQTSHSICVTTPSETRLTVDFLKLAGADFIKPYNLSRDLYLAIASEARRIGIPFGGHAHNIAGQEASDSGARFLDHGTWFNPFVCGEPDYPPADADAVDPAACAAAIERLRRNGTWIVETPGCWGWQLFPEPYSERLRRYEPELAATDFGAGIPDFIAKRDSLLPTAPRRPASFADWQTVWRSAANPDPGARDTSTMRWRQNYYAERRGMPVVAGTDVSAKIALDFGFVAGYSLHEALVWFVLSGMTPLEALQTATLNPAKAMHLTDSLGTIAAGKLADLVLLDANPLEDIWNTTKIRAVFTNGHYYDREALDRLLAITEQIAHRP